MSSTTTPLKLRTLVELEFNQDQFLEALELVKDIRWSTTGVEPQHGSVSTITKLHEGNSTDATMI